MGYQRHSFWFCYRGCDLRKGRDVRGGGTPAVWEWVWYGMGMGRTRGCPHSLGHIGQPHISHGGPLIDHKALNRCGRGGTYAVWEGHVVARRVWGTSGSHIYHMGRP